MQMHICGHARRPPLPPSSPAPPSPCPRATRLLPGGGIVPRWVAGHVAKSPASSAASGSPIEQSVHVAPRSSCSSRCSFSTCSSCWCSSAYEALVDVFAGSKGSKHAGALRQLQLQQRGCGSDDEDEEEEVTRTRARAGVGRLGARGWAEAQMLVGAVCACTTFVHALVRVGGEGGLGCSPVPPLPSCVCPANIPAASVECVGRGTCGGAGGGRARVGGCHGGPPAPRDHHQSEPEPK